MTGAANAPALSMTRADAEDFLYHEARLLDEVALEEWLTLFASDGIYWIPIDDTTGGGNVSIVYDPPLRREERVYHLLHTTFPSQSPRSRTVHTVANVQTGTNAESGEIWIRSNQIIYEIRAGDYRQPGLGALQVLVATVEHVLKREDDAFRIALKKIKLIDRDLPLGNLTFLI